MKNGAARASPATPAPAALLYPSLGPSLSWVDKNFGHLSLNLGLSLVSLDLSMPASVVTSWYSISHACRSMIGSVVQCDSAQC